MAGRLLHHAADGDVALGGGRAGRRDHAVRADLVRTERLSATTDPPVSLAGGDHVGQERRALGHEVVRQEHGEGLVADVEAGHADGVAEPARLVLADEVDVRHLADGQDLGQRLVLAAAREGRLELGRAVEVVLDRLLGPAGHDEDVLDARRHGLLDDVLDPRLVDQGDHLLGRRLGGREEAGAEPRGGDDCLADTHGATVRTPRGVATADARASVSGGTMPGAGRAHQRRPSGHGP